MIRKTILTIALLLLSCSPEPIDLYRVQDPSRKTYIKIDSVENSTQEDLERLQEVVETLEVIINSKAFYDEVMGARFTTTELSNQEVYDIIVSGREYACPEQDDTLNLNIIFMDRPGAVAGMANKRLNTIRINRGHFNRYSLGFDAGVLMHEWTHLAEFDHTGFGDRTSVPYSMDRIMNKLL